MRFPKIFFNSQPIEPEVPLATQVRNSLKTCLRDIRHTDEEFEKLFHEVLDDEVYGRKNAAELINNFVRTKR